MSNPSAYIENRVGRMFQGASQGAREKGQPFDYVVLLSIESDLKNRRRSYFMNTNTEVLEGMFMMLLNEHHWLSLLVSQNLLKYLNQYQYAMSLGMSKTMDRLFTGKSQCLVEYSITKMTEREVDLATSMHDKMHDTLSEMVALANEEGMLMEYIILANTKPKDSTGGKNSIHIHASYNTQVNLIMNMLEECPELLLMLSRSIIQNKGRFLDKEWGRSARKEAEAGFKQISKKLLNP